MIRTRIAAVLRARFPNNPVAPEHFGDLLAEYAESGIGPPHLINEIETGDERAIWSFIWEAMLYRQLRLHGFEPKSSGKHGGPDFRIEYEGQTIWIEAVVPAPDGIPPGYLELRPGELKSKPDIERVLRCTSVIRGKRDKLAGYRTKGIIGATDPTVIAINICRLSEHDIDGNGISQLPLSMEALFPIGPLAVPITHDGKIDGPMQNTPRFSVQKSSGTDIATSAFLDPAFVGVSAVIQAHQRDMYGHDLALATVHNPLASNPLPRGLFGACKEFVAEPNDDGYQIHDVRVEARLSELHDSVERRFGEREDRPVRPITLAEAGGFVGEPNKCHENVNRWCFMREHFSHMPARGWLISGDNVLDKHSVVDMGEGELVDVTPMQDGIKRTFLPHDGSEDEFWAMPNQIILVR